jgi:nucleoside-diphosphate-sugar epimerase
VIGQRLLPKLAAAGHDVIGVSREQGTDLLDRQAVRRAVRTTRPDAIVHMATAIPARINPRTMTRDFALTSRLRTEGTRNLIDAAAEAGVKRLITQGLAYAYEPGEGLADEDAPLWVHPPAQFAPVLAALVNLEQLTREADGLVLRFGQLYGPGSAFSPAGSYTEQVRAGKLPIAGKGESVLSFTHATDAASAIVAALDSDVAGVLNVVDDAPVKIRDWLPAFAAMLGAPAPRQVPAAVVRLAVGGWGAAFMTKLRGASNTRAKATLKWRPSFPSWTEGFAAGFGGEAARLRGTMSRRLPAVWMAGASGIHVAGQGVEDGG